MSDLILIDPGHGGSLACGSSTPIGVIGRGGAREKDLALDLALRLREALRSSGLHAALTREGDTNLALSERIGAARRTGAGRFVSLHFNGSPSTHERGSEAWVHSAAPRSARELGLALQEALAAAGLPGRGVRPGPLAVLDPARHLAGVEATLLEIGYLTNPAEEAHLAQDRHRARIALELARALARPRAVGRTPFCGAQGSAAARALDDPWQSVVVGDGGWDQSMGSLCEQGAPIALELRGQEAATLAMGIVRQAFEDGVLQQILAGRPPMAQGMVAGVDDAIVIAAIAVIGAVVLALGLFAIGAVCTVVGMTVLAVVINNAIDHDYEVVDAGFNGGSDVKSIFPTSVLTGLIGIVGGGAGSGAGGGGGGSGGGGLSSLIPGPVRGLIPGGGGGSGSDPVSAQQNQALTFKLRKRQDPAQGS